LKKKYNELVKKNPEKMEGKRCLLESKYQTKISKIASRLEMPAPPKL
jgi:hypothetical protein